MTPRISSHCVSTNQSIGLPVASNSRESEPPGESAETGLDHSDTGATSVRTRQRTFNAVPGPRLSKGTIKMNRSPASVSLYFQPSAVTNGRALSATARYDASADAAAATALTAAMPMLISVALTDVIVPGRADGIRRQPIFYATEGRRTRVAVWRSQCRRSESRLDLGSASDAIVSWDYRQRPNAAK